MCRVLKKTSLLFLAFLLTFTCNRSESAIVDSPIEVKTISLYQLKQNPLATNLKISIRRTLAGLKREISENLLVLSPMSGTSQFSTEPVHLALIVKGESVETNRELQKRIVTRQFNLAFKLLSQYQVTAFRATADFSVFTHLAVIFEKRSTSFLRQSAEAKSAIILSEQRTLSESNPSIAVSNNWVFSGGSTNVVKVVGLSSSYNWASIDLEGSYYRGLQKVEKSDVLVFENIKDSSINNLLP